MPETTHRAPELPTEGEIELADYKISSYLSDLDEMVSAIKQQSRQLTPEEYLRLRAEGKLDERLDDIEEDRLDASALTRIVVFATDALNDAETIRTEATMLQQAALALYHETAPSAKRDPEGWAAYRERIGEWHREAGRWYGGDDG